MGRVKLKISEINCVNSILKKKNKYIRRQKRVEEAIELKALELKNDPSALIDLPDPESSEFKRAIRPLIRFPPEYENSDLDQSVESDYSPRVGEKNYLQAKVPIKQNKPEEQEEEKKQDPIRLVANPPSPVAPRSIPVNSFSAQHFGGYQQEVRHV